VRIVLVTGKGGVGKTTAAAATALGLAERGAKTLLVSSDSTDSVADVLAATVDDEPREVHAGLWAVRLDPQRRFQRAWRDIEAHLVDLIDKSGIDPITAAELTVLPGVEQALALLQLRELARSGHWDVVVLDCPPTADTLRLLALPEALDWYLAKVLPAHSRLARSGRPWAALLGRDQSLPTDAVFGALLSLRADLRATRDLLTDPAVTTVRLVLTPEAVVVAEARRSFTALSLHGYRVDLIVANRVFAPGRDAFRQSWVAAQRTQLAVLRDGFAGRPIVQVPYGPAEPVGPDALREVYQAMYRDRDPLRSGAPSRVMSVDPDGDGFLLRLWLPMAHRSQVDALRVGDDLVVTVGAYRRVLSLPSVLRRCDVVGARFDDDDLVIRFIADPALWPRPTGE
jgi:arsenite-transporting ATPase